MKNRKPILFCTKDVQAITNGEKTTTRRKCKELANYDFPNGLDEEPYISDYEVFEQNESGEWGYATKKDQWLFEFQTKVDDSKTGRLKPPYQVGDTLWVRETWQEGYKGKVDENGEPIIEYIYKAREGNISVDKWCPSIHMPKEAARIFLKITDVRIERLQAITEKEARKEGIETDEVLEYFEWVDLVAPPGSKRPTLRAEFADHWDSMLNKEDCDEYSWESNPWVWVIEFEKVDVKEFVRAYNVS